MKVIYIIILFLSIGMQLQSQTVKETLVTKMPTSNNIDDFIRTVKNKKHKGFLLEFAKGRDSLTQISVQGETKKLYEIWVDYRTADGYQWGEGYTLNKRDAKREMIWHEQPYKYEPLILEDITKKKTENSCIEKKAKN